MPRAFISYAREDLEFVRQHVKPALRVLGLDSFLDLDDLHGAEPWQEVIRRALTECDCFLVVVTMAGAASPAVRGEVEWILNHRRGQLIPILAGPVRLDGVHAELPGIQHVDCVGRTPGQSVTMIVKALYQLQSRTLAVLDEQKRQLADKLEQLDEERRELEIECKSITGQLERLASFDGDWRQPPLGEVAAFLPREERKAPIVAVMNVKGGVGKSTITANLAATWGTRKRDPKRVLIVDLDFQQSVSGLCLDAPTMNDLRTARLLVSDVFDERVDAEAHFAKAIRRIGGAGGGYVLAADDGLTRTESQMMARWLTGQTKQDVRYRLRRLLHSPAVQDRFDLVLIDCPPGIRTASINALAAADFVFIPVLLDVTSSIAVPRMLAWLKEYRRAGVCPELEILGILANRKSDARKEFLIREANLWDELPQTCRTAWGGEVPLCRTVIKQSSAIAEAAKTPGRFACEHADVRQQFLELTNELDSRLSVPVELTTP